MRAVCGAVGLLLVLLEVAIAAKRDLQAARLPVPAEAAAVEVASSVAPAQQALPTASAAVQYRADVRGTPEQTVDQRASKVDADAR